MRKELYSYEREKDYYSKAWPEKALSYQHLDPYLRCWLDPEAVFGNKRVLDIGAGECTYTRLIADRFKPKTIVACELFRERMVPVVRANQNPRLYFISGNSFQLPFKNKSFDVVFGSFILHQLPGLNKIVEELKRVLTSGGLYIGIEPNPYHPVVFYRYFFKNHSANQYLLNSKHLKVFQDSGFELKIRYFYAKYPLFRNRFLTTCIGIMARQKEVQLPDVEKDKKDEQ